MRKVLSILIVLAFAAFYVNGQTKLTNSDHNIQAGDEHYFYMSNKVQPGVEGMNQYWDFSELKKTDELIAKMYSNFGTEYATVIPEADVILEEFGNKFLFRTKNNKVELFGTVNKCGTTTYFDQPFLKMQFPFEYGDITTGNYSATSINATNKSYSFDGEYNLEIDATGTLLLPGDREFENVVRMKIIQERRYKNGSSTTVSYKWYCKDLRYPLLTIIGYERNGEFKPTTTAYYSKTLRVEEIEETDYTGPVLDQTNFRIYPNPFSEQLKVDYVLMKEANVEITVYDNSGRKIRTEKIDNQPKGVYTQDLNLNEKDIPSGILHVRVKAGSDIVTESVIKSE